MTTPESIKPHADDYKEGSWKEYSFSELGQWVELLSKRATHRKNPEKRKKDLYDAKNYLDMMVSRLEDICQS